jgi:hypothetical protein
MRSLSVLTTICLFSSSLLGAENPFVGTWKLNTAKSKFTPGPGIRSETLKYELDGNKIKRTVTGIDAEGKPLTQGTDKASSAWDGEEHEVSTSPGVVTSVSVKKITDRVVDVTIKGDGKVIDRIRSVVSKDGRTLTNTEIGVNEKGQKSNNVEVFDKQ